MTRGSPAVQAYDYICNRKRTDGATAMVRDTIVLLVAATLCVLALQAFGVA